MSQEKIFGEELSDQQLVSLAKEKNLEAFQSLVFRYQKKVYFMALRMTKDHDSADDIAQESFVKAYLNLSSFKTEYPFGSWIFKICMNLAINYLKREKRLVREENIKDETEFTTVESLFPSEADKLREEIQKAVDALPADFKAVFVLRIYEEQSYDQIARVLGISRGTVMSRLFRARKKLQKSLKKYYHLIRG